MHSRSTQTSTTWRHITGKEHHGAPAAASRSQTDEGKCKWYHLPWWGVPCPHGTRYAHYVEQGLAWGAFLRAHSQQPRIGIATDQGANLPAEHWRGWRSIHLRTRLSVRAGGDRALCEPAPHSHAATKPAMCWTKFGTTVVGRSLLGQYDISEDNTRD